VEIGTAAVFAGSVEAQIVIYVVSDSKAEERGSVETFVDASDRIEAAVILVEQVTNPLIAEPDIATQIPTGKIRNWCQWWYCKVRGMCDAAHNERSDHCKQRTSKRQLNHTIDLHKPTPRGDWR